MGDLGDAKFWPSFDLTRIVAAKILRSGKSSDGAIPILNTVNDARSWVRGGLPILKYLR